jgi:hypothetical protein
MLFTVEYIFYKKEKRNTAFRKEGHFSVQAELDSFFKPALLRSKTNTSSESSIDE